MSPFAWPFTDRAAKICTQFHEEEMEDASEKRGIREEKLFVNTHIVVSNVVLRITRATPDSHLCHREN